MKSLELAKDTIRTWFALDYRSLAILRVGVALTIIFDLIQRSKSMLAHYTDWGVVPRSELFRLWDTQWMFSVHLASGDLWFQILLFSIAGIFALCLLFGYRTNFSVAVSWLLLISLQTRNPMVLQGGDIVLRTALFFMMFLPLNRVWSIDRLFNRVARVSEKTVFDMATVSYVIQICLLYIFTGVLKTGSAWHSEGSAVYYALAIDQLVTPIGVFLRNLPNSLPFFTHAVWLFETFGTILFFIPWKNWIFRTLGVFGFIFMQFGFNSAMRLGFFGMIAATTILGMLPSEFWDTIVFPLVKKWKYRGTPNLTIVYDYDCSFCHKISFLIARILLLHPSTAIVSSDQHTMGKGIMEKEDSWVVISGNGAVTTGFRGFLTVLSHSPSVGFLAPFFSISPVATLGEYIYRFVARRRKLVCLPEPEEKPRGVLFSIVKNGAATFFILLAIGWNLESLGYGVVPDSLRKFALLTRMDQKFNMFAPTPLVEDGWYVMPGTLRNHTEIDVFSGKSPVSYEKPRWVAYTYKDQRWQKYLMNLWSSDLSEFRLGYGQYICRIWNTKHMNTNEELLSFDIIFMVERTPPPGSKQTPIEPTPIWHHECF